MQVMILSGNTKILLRFYVSIYFKLKEAALDRTVWGTGCGAGCGPAVRKAIE